MFVLNQLFNKNKIMNLLTHVNQLLDYKRK